MLQNKDEQQYTQGAQSLASKPEVNHKLPKGKPTRNMHPWHMPMATLAQNGSMPSCCGVQGTVCSVPGQAASAWWEGHAPEAAAQVDQQLVGGSLGGGPAGSSSHTRQQVQQGLAVVTHLVVDVGQGTQQAAALTQPDDLQEGHGAWLGIG